MLRTSWTYQVIKETVLKKKSHRLEFIFVSKTKSGIVQPDNPKIPLPATHDAGQTANFLTFKKSVGQQSFIETV